MSGMNPDSHSSSQHHAAGGDTCETDRVARLDPALWALLAEASSPEHFAQSWLTLQCTIIQGVRRGVVVLDDLQQEQFQPAGVWPDSEQPVPSALQAAAELAMSERRGVVTGSQAGEGSDSKGRPRRYIG